MARKSPGADFAIIPGKRNYRGNHVARRGLEAVDLGYRQGIDNRKIPAHYPGMRRKAGSLVPLEVAILDALVELRRHGTAEAHGFQIAFELRALGDDRRLTAYGTLYKALDRLADSGAIDSRWEDPEVAAQEGRPRRRYHRITLTGETALAEAGPIGRRREAARRGAATR
jgi:DNA-binding PadR family transcriptional regulator